MLFHIAFNTLALFQGLLWLHLSASPVHQIHSCHVTKIVFLQEKNRINKEGELVITSTRSRSQA